MIEFDWHMFAHAIAAGTAAGISYAVGYMRGKRRMKEVAELAFGNGVRIGRAEARAEATLSPFGSFGIQQGVSQPGFNAGMPK